MVSGGRSCLLYTSVVDVNLMSRSSLASVSRPGNYVLGDHSFKMIIFIRNDILELYMLSTGFAESDAVHESKDRRR